MDYSFFSSGLRFFVLTAIAFLSFFTTDTEAQLINLKTAPVATGDQFLVQPPVNAGMAGLSIALDDTLADPFVNPAKTGRIQGSHVYMVPTFYRINNGYGGASTMGVGGLAGGNDWFWGLGVAVQEMDIAPAGSNLLKDKSANNNYITARAGKWINHSSSVGVSLFWAGLGAMNGVNLLYPRSERIDQHGYLLDLRVGLSGKTNGTGNYEVLAIFNRADMTHEVTYQANFDTWFGITNTVTSGPQQVEIEENLDKTNTWGLHLGYDQPVGEEGWKLGSIFTLNYKTHPKIPNYELMNIPRDPGNTWAFNVGLGASHKSEDNVTFGTELLIEPVWSNTWVEAEEDITNPAGGPVLVEKGEKTIENDFEFVNSVIKTGLGWRGERVQLGAGILAKTYRYRLKQHDYVQQRYRRQREHWTEWTFSISAGIIFNSLAIKYTGLLTTGTGQPGTTTATVWNTSLDSAASYGSVGGDFIFAPDGELALNSAGVLTHQIAVTIPI